MDGVLGNGRWRARIPERSLITGAQSDRPLRFPTLTAPECRCPTAKLPCTTQLDSFSCPIRAPESCDDLESSLRIRRTLLVIVQGLIAGTTGASWCRKHGSTTAQGGKRAGGTRVDSWPCRKIHRSKTEFLSSTAIQHLRHSIK